MPNEILFVDLKNQSILSFIMKKILVPTDFSPKAENALKVAAQLARKQNAEIYLPIGRAHV